MASITGLVAKENIVGTMGILYSGGWPEIGANFSMAAGYSFLVFNLLCAPYQIASAFNGNLNVIGLLAALVILGGMIYILFKPYQEATKLTAKVKMAR